MACGEVDYTDDSLHPAGLAGIETERDMRGQMIRKLQRTKRSQEKRVSRWLGGENWWRFRKKMEGAHRGVVVCTIASQQVGILAVFAGCKSSGHSPTAQKHASSVAWWLWKLYFRSESGIVILRVCGPAMNWQAVQRVTWIPLTGPRGNRRRMEESPD